MERLDPLRPLIPRPLWQKLVGLVGLFVVLPLLLYGLLVWQGMLDEIGREKQNIAMQRTLLQKNRRLAADLPRKQKEYARLELQLRVALNLLPRKAEIPDLLESVSWAGKDSGLEFTTFKPLGEKPQGLYAEVPVSIEMGGDYKQLIRFLARVGEMPRIVNVNSLSIRRDQGDRLKISGRVTTYRFLEEEQGKKKGKRKRKRGRRGA
ncbi:MAG: pilus assembly protein PilO [Zetaproteobacteria bacterium]|nr:MAG: pilus assembly protein PilO [Zetaproteobacteria bacterium]